MNNFSVSAIEKTLQDTFDNLDREFAGVGHPDWWASSTGQAGGLNATALNKVNQELVKALHQVDASPDIVL